MARSASAAPQVPRKRRPPGRQVLADNYPPLAHNLSMNKIQSPVQSVSYVPGPYPGGGTPTPPIPQGGINFP